MMRFAKFCPQSEINCVECQLSSAAFCEIFDFVFDLCQCPPLFNDRRHEKFSAINNYFVFNNLRKPQRIKGYVWHAVLLCVCTDGCTYMKYYLNSISHTARAHAVLMMRMNFLNVQVHVSFRQLTSQESHGCSQQLDYHRILLYQVIK